MMLIDDERERDGDAQTIFIKPKDRYYTILLAKRKKKVIDATLLSLFLFLSNLCVCVYA